MGQPLAGRRIGLLTSSASRLGGGVFEAVAAQAAIIRDLGGEAPVFAIADDHAEADRQRLAPSPVVLSACLGPGQIGYAPGMLASLLEAGLDCLHLHGIWMYPSRAAMLWTRKTGRPLVISPHGMLDPWITSRGRWKKALARAGYERASWQAAATFHALTRQEAADIERESGRGNSLVIANAGPEPRPARQAMPPPLVAYVGRIHPKKNLEALIAAWRQARLPEGAELAIAGWGEDEHVCSLRRQAEAAGPSVRFLGPVYGETKQDLLDAARFVILPSLSEGLPMAMLEAWAAGAPAIMTGQCNLPEGFAAGAAIECGYDAPAIAQALEQALRIAGQDWLALSQAARGLAANRFSTEVIARRWEQAYLQVISHDSTARPIR
ncbi:MAG: glycosyltransferase [Novosphingobium sp.]